MKKIVSILAILLLVISSCSSDDGGSSNSSEIQINPPNWIQGKWLLEDSGLGETGWTFTSNDFIILTANAQLSQREQLQTLLDNGGDVSASDNSTDETYSVTLNSIGGQTVIYSFTKISDNEITWDTISTSIYTKQ